jgi:hypothetical protein
MGGILTDGLAKCLFNLRSWYHFEFSDAPKGAGFVRGYIFCMVALPSPTRPAGPGSVRDGKQIVNELQFQSAATTTAYSSLPTIAGRASSKETEASTTASPAPRRAIRVLNLDPIPDGAAPDDFWHLHECCAQDRHDCDYATEVEPDQDRGWCESCGTNTVKSALILAGLI